VKSRFRSCVPQWLALEPEVPQTWNYDLLTLEGHDEKVTALSFSKDGKYLATASVDETVRVWDASKGDCISTFSGSPSPDLAQHPVPAAVTFTPNNDQVVLASQWQTETGFEALVMLHDIETGTIVRTLGCIRCESPMGTQYKGDGFDSPQIRLSFAHEDNETLLVATFNRYILECWRMSLHSDVPERIWRRDMRPSKHEGINHEGVREVQPYDGKQDLTMSAEATLVVCGTHGKYYTCWNLESGDPVHELFLVDSGIWPIAFEDSNLLCITNDELLKHARLQSQNILTGHVTQVNVVPDFHGTSFHKPAITLAGDKLACTFHPHHTVQIRQLSHSSVDKDQAYARSSLLMVRVSPSAEKILYIFPDYLELRELHGTTVFRSPTIGDLGYMVYNHDRSLALSMSADDNMIAVEQLGSSIGQFGRIGVWLVRSGKEVELPDIALSRYVPEFSSDGRFLAFYSEESKRITLWDLELNREAQSFNAPWLDVDELAHENDDERPSLFDIPPEQSTGGCYEAAIPKPPRVNRSCLSLHDKWVSWNSVPILWLPEQYRPVRNESYSVVGNTIAIMRRHDDVTAMKITDPFPSSAPGNSGQV